MIQRSVAKNIQLRRLFLCFCDLFKCSNITFNHLTCLARRGVENALVSITLAYNSPRSVAILQIYITSLKRQFRDFFFSRRFCPGGPGVLHLQSQFCQFIAQKMSRFQWKRSKSEHIALNRGWIYLKVIFTCPPAPPSEHRSIVRHRQ